MQNIIFIRRVMWVTLLIGSFGASNAFCAEQPSKDSKEQKQVEIKPVNKKVDEIISEPAEDKFEDKAEETSQELRKEMRKKKAKQLYQSAISDKVADGPAAVKSRVDKLINNPDLTPEMRADLHQERGMMSLVLRDFAASKKDLDKAIAMLGSFPKLTPEQKFSLANAHYGRGAISLYSGKAAASLSEFDIAINISPATYMYRLKCRALITLGRYDDAVKTFESGVNFSPKFKSEAKEQCVALQKNAKMEKCE